MGEKIINYNIDKVGHKINYFKQKNCCGEHISCFQGDVCLITDKYRHKKKFYVTIFCRLVKRFYSFRCLDKVYLDSVWGMSLVSIT